MDGIVLGSLIVVGFGLAIAVYVHFTTTKQDNTKG